MKVCMAAALVAAGAWTFLWDNKPFTITNPYERCPTALELPAFANVSAVLKAALNHQFTVHTDRYACTNRAFVNAVFQAPKCHFNSIEESVKSFSMTNNIPSNARVNFPTKKILFVGDSLMVQNYLALQCELEEKSLLHILQPELRVDYMLRRDVPCEDKCLTSETYFHEHRLKGCFSCTEDRKRREYTNYHDDPLIWSHSITNETIAVVLGTGSWYNTHKHIMNHTSIYRDTLVKTRELIEEVVTRRKAMRILPPLQFYWMGLPPIIVSPMFDKYDWLSYQEKDHIANEILGQEEHVTFVNVSKVTLEFKKINTQLVADGLHWCNPGDYSIPHFLNRLLLQYIVDKTAQVK